MVDTNQALPAVPSAATAWAKSQTRSWEGMLRKLHKTNISETLRYYLKYSSKVMWGKKLQEMHGVDILQFFVIDCANQGLMHTGKINGGVRCEQCETNPKYSLHKKILEGVKK